MDEINRTIFVGKKSNAEDLFKYFKPLIEDCKASNIKPSELSIASLDDRWMVKRKMTDKEKIERLEDIQFFKKQLRTVGDNKDKPSELIGCKCRKDKTFKPIMVECEKTSLTRRQIKESNDALNKLNAKNPTKRPVEDKNILLRGKGKKLSDVVTGLDGFCTIGKKRGA